MASFEFPVTKGMAVRNIGQGFDLIAGVALDPAAMDPPDDDDVTVTGVTGGNSSWAMTRDTASFASAVTNQLDMAGSGWGCSVGLSLSESSLSTSQSSAITINFDAFLTSSQKVINADVALSDDAMDLWTNDNATFIEKYGSYFVAGYIYGKRCSLAYRMSFQSQEEKESFSADLSTNYSGVDFSTGMSDAITTSQKSATSSFSADTVQKFAGYDGGGPDSTLEALDDARQAYVDADPDSTPIRVIVMPWNHLTALQSNSADLAPGDPLATLTDMINKLGYVTRSCGAFRDDDLYAGNTQLTAVEQVLSKAQAELDAIIQTVRNASQTGVALTNDDVAKFAAPEPIIDTADHALKTFALAFKVHIADSDDDCNNLSLDRNGNPFPSVVNRVFDGSTGMDLTWSIAGNDGWPGTKGTTKMSHIIARTISQGQLTANIVAVVDRQAGTLQIFRLGVGESFDQNQRSPVVQIRGRDNSLPCDDPNNTASIVQWAGNDGLVVSAGVF
ncbi:MAG TPA: hypothetical protein VGW57_09490 [Chthoniobacterales bacterium]|nr:hypothetical protein [Chthoniobacterales bacterium]